MTAIIALAVAVVAGGAGYYVGSQSGGGGSVVATSIQPASANDPVVARVNTAPIYKSEVDALIAELGDQAQQMPADELRSRVLDRLIDLKIATQKAIAEKADEDPGIKKRVQTEQMSSLATAYVEKLAKAKINDNVLKAKYDELIKQVQPVQEVHARHILLKTEADAKDVIKQLDKGADFAKLAKEKSTDPGIGDSGGDLGYFTKDKMVPEFAEAAFAMEKGQYTKTPVRSQFGYHVIQVLDKRNQPLPPFEGVKGQLTSMVMQDQEQKILADMRSAATIERLNADGTVISTEKPPAAEPAAPAPAATPAPAAAPASQPATSTPAPAAK